MYESQTSLENTKKSFEFRRLATKELALLTGFLFFGLVIMPVVIYYVGQAVFGSYGGHGYGSFFGTLTSKITSGDYVAWFLVLSPYLGWQILRLLAFAWRKSGQDRTA